MKPNRPNVLFIVLDTQRRDRLSLYGQVRPTSPHLDTFAQESQVFLRAIAPAQWTIPAHGSLFTGVYPSQHQLTQAFQTLSPSFPTLAEILQVADYDTVAFCNNPLLGVLDNGLQRGFDQFYNYGGATPNRPQKGAQTGAIAEFARRFNRFARQVTNRFAHSDALFRLGLHPLFTPIWTRFANYKGNTARSLADLADFWNTHRQARTRPLFAYVNLMGTHMPLRPDRKHLFHIAPHLRHDKQAHTWMAQHNADGARWISPIEAPLTDWQQEAISAYYDAEIHAQDQALGTLFNTLKAWGELDNTLVIVVADHGEGHGDHLHFGHSFVVYQELVHVPLLIRYPERFAQGIHTENISTRRLFHTVLDIAQVSPPLAEDDPNADITRLSLTTAQGEAGVAMSEAYPPVNLLNMMKDKRAPLVEKMRLHQVRRSLYAGDYKLATVGADVEHLFNVAQDPAEQHDIAHENTLTVQHLSAQLSDFVAKIAHNVPQNAASGYSEEVIENLRALGYLD